MYGGNCPSSNTPLVKTMLVLLVYIYTQDIDLNMFGNISYNNNTKNSFYNSYQMLLNHCQFFNSEYFPNNISSPRIIFLLK